MRPHILSWSVGFGLLLIAFVITIATLNSTLYSASGFVANYLDALERRDASTALGLPGVFAQEGAASDLLTPEAMGDLSGERTFSEETGGGDVRTVTVEYLLGDTPRESAFRVKRTGALFGLFQTWAFDTSPLASVAVTVLHDDRFRVNEVPLTSGVAPTESERYLVFTPGLYVFDHETIYLTADPVPVAVTEPGSVTAVQVNVQANAVFVDRVRDQLSRLLDECTQQEVLQPTGCPFGRAVQNRVNSPPQWSMVTYPDIEIVPTREVDQWLVPDASAVARLVVEERSLFDGTVSTIDEEVSFSVSYLITMLPGDALQLDPRG